MSLQDAIDLLQRKLQRRQSLNQERGWQQACYTLTFTLREVEQIRSLLEAAKGQG